MTAANRGGGYTEPARGLAGMVAFAGMMLALVGFFDILQGLTALFNDEYFVVAKGDLLLFDFTTWGVVTLIWGAMLVAAGLGLLSGRGGRADLLDRRRVHQHDRSRSRSSRPIRSGRRSSSRSRSSCSTR